MRHEQPEGLDGYFKPAGYDTNPDHMRVKRQRTEKHAGDQLPPPLPAPLPEPVPFDHGDNTSTLADVSMTPASPSKEERKRLKKEKKERKEEKKKRKSEAASQEA